MSAVNERLYKGRYFIVFYDLDDETYIVGFDNVRQICLYRGEEPNKANMANYVSELYHALKRTPHVTTLLGNKRKSLVYLIEDTDDDE